jgi:hypothetical protein
MPRKRPAQSPPTRTGTITRTVKACMSPRAACCPRNSVRLFAPLRERASLAVAETGTWHRGRQIAVRQG